MHEEINKNICFTAKTAILTEVTLIYVLLEENEMDILRVSFVFGLKGFRKIELINQISDEILQLLLKNKISSEKG